MHSLLSPTTFFKAAAKVVESKRARTTVSQDNDVDMETQANLEVRKRFVNLFTYFLSFYVKVVLVSHY